MTETQRQKIDLKTQVITILLMSIGIVAVFSISTLLVANTYLTQDIRDSKRLWDCNVHIRANSSVETMEHR